MIDVISVIAWRTPSGSAMIVPWLQSSRVNAFALTPQ